uniref:ABC-2 type transporter transmembrane domain-containing protein n=1 Tax=Timema genevievae TaxID=629358 RepID=A0A7R9K937_TIMGE|nr:unnamed protein product [Timema genevievae]
MEIIQGEEPLDILRAMSVEIQNGKSREGDPEKESVGIQLNSLKKATTKLCRQDTMRTLPKVFSFSSKKDSSYNMHFPNSSYTQFKILLRRMALQSSRNKSIFFIMLLHHIFSGFVLGGIYFGSANDATKPFMNFKFCISVLVFFMYTHIMTQVLIFPTEVKLLQREYFNRWYGLKPYYMALTVSTLPTMILFGSIFLAISYLLSAQPLDILRFMKYSFICLLIGAVSEGYGLAIGSMFNVMVSRSTVAPINKYRLATFVSNNITF